MYPSFLLAHSLFRWLVIGAGLRAVVKAVMGLTGRAPWQPSDDYAGRSFVMALDIQTLIGLILWIALSPYTTAAMGDMAGTMRSAPLRFIVVEHGFGMLVALALAHVGRVRIRKTADLVARHRTALVFFGVALVILLLSTPWPFMPAGRPLLRGF
jgi:pimeloyl-ACP methyl ester carboxylesterase